MANHHEKQDQPQPGKEGPNPHPGGLKGATPKRATSHLKKREGEAPQPEGRGNHYHNKDGQGRSNVSILFLEIKI